MIGKEQQRFHQGDRNGEVKAATDAIRVTTRLEASSGRKRAEWEVGAMEEEERRRGGGPGHGLNRDGSWRTLSPVTRQQQRHRSRGTGRRAMGAGERRRFGSDR